MALLLDVELVSLHKPSINAKTETERAVLIGLEEQSGSGEAVCSCYYYYYPSSDFLIEGWVDLLLSLCV